MAAVSSRRCGWHRVTRPRDADDQCSRQRSPSAWAGRQTESPVLHYSTYTRTSLARRPNAKLPELPDRPAYGLFPDPAPLHAATSVATSSASRVPSLRSPFGIVQDQPSAHCSSSSSPFFLPRRRGNVRRCHVRYHSQHASIRMRAEPFLRHVQCGKQRVPAYRSRCDSANKAASTAITIGVAAHR